MKNKDEILKKAVEYYGDFDQLRQLQEECAELIVAVNHLMRENSEKNTDNLLEEVADVKVLFDQLSFIFGPNAQQEINEIYDMKLKRLAERIGKAK